MFFTGISLVLRLGGKSLSLHWQNKKQHEMFSKTNPINPHEFFTYTQTQ